jgi:hypothetical protein
MITSRAAIGDQLKTGHSGLVQDREAWLAEILEPALGVVLLIGETGKPDA